MSMFRVSQTRNKVPSMIIKISKINLVRANFFCLLSLSSLFLSPQHTHPYCHCSPPKPHLSSHLFDQRRSSDNAQPLTSQFRVGMAASTRRGRSFPADQSRDWLTRSSSNHRVTVALVFPISATSLEVLSCLDLHQVKPERASSLAVVTPRQAVGHLGRPPPAQNELNSAQKRIKTPRAVWTNFQA